MTKATPRAWIGSLTAYNAGRLVGAWIDLEGKDAEEVTAEAIEAMRPQIAGFMSEAEAFDELHVFDHENLAPLVSGECGVLEAVEAAAILETVEDREIEAFRAWLANGEEADIDTFRDRYLGNFDRLEDYAEQLTEDTGMLNSIPENLRAYFNVEAYARDLQLGGDLYTVPDGSGGVFVFSNY